MTEFKNPVLTAVEEIGDAFSDFKKSHDDKAAALLDRVERLEAGADRPGKGEGSRDEQEHKSLFLDWLREPHNGSRKRHLDDAQNELKAVSLGTDSAGGYALPALIAREVEQRVTTLNPFRQICRVQRVGSSDYAHLVSRNEAGSGWAAENDARSESATSVIDQRKPTFGSVYAYPFCSEEALADIFFNVEDWLIGEVADAFAAAEATAIVSGNGTARPTGFLNTAPVTTADGASPQRSADAIQYIPMDSTSPQALHADDLFDLAGAFRDGYLQGPSCAWVMRNATLTVIRKLKDSNNAYLLEPSLQEGVPPRLLGYPVYLTDAMQAYVADAHPIAFGNWNRGYLIADRSDIMVTVDANITTPGKIKFYVRKRVGGIILNNQAIKVLKFADT